MPQVVKKQYVSKNNEWVEVPVGGGPAAPVGMNDLTDADTVTKAPSARNTLTWDGTNWVPTKPAVAILNYQGPSAALPQYGDVIPFTSADLSNTDVMTFSAPGIVVNRSGRYLICGSVAYAPAGPITQDQGVLLQVNGTGVYWAQDRSPSAAGSGFNSSSMTTTMLLKASDRVEMVAFSATAGSVIEFGHFSMISLDADPRYLKVGGDAMMGQLILAADPTVPLGAATKQYVDTRVAVTGDTMTGTLTVSAPGAVYEPQIAIYSTDAVATVRFGSSRNYGNRLESRGGAGFYFYNDQLALAGIHASAFAAIPMSDAQHPLAVNEEGNLDLMRAAVQLFDAISAMPGGPEALASALEGGA